MGTKLASCALVATTGCSLIYNPNNVSVVDAMPDAEIILDADPAMLTLTGVSPAQVIEGQGDGSRPIVLVVQGMHMVQNATSVAITAHAGETATPVVTVDNAKLQVADNGNLLAVPISLAVDSDLGAGAFIRLDVSVTQQTAAGPVTRTLSGLDEDAPVLMLRGLGELTEATSTLAAGTYEYSRVAIAGTLTAQTGAAPLVVRATSSIAIGGAVRADATGRTAGPGGGAGGAGGPGSLVGNAAGEPGGGAGGGAPSGGGGKYTGDDQLTSLGVRSRGSGGAGGNGGSLGAAGGAGGGGGGTVELTAGGDLSLGGGSAKGAAGLNGANGGGGGGGGVVLLRSGGMLTVDGAIDVGPGGAGSPSGGVGDPGRVRLDAPTLAMPLPGFRGPTLAANTPLIVRTPTPTLSVLGQPNTTFSYFVRDATGGDSRGPEIGLFPANGMAVITLGIELFRGSNELCLIVEGASTASDTSTCVQLAYLPQRTPEI